MPGDASDPWDDKGWSSVGAEQLERHVCALQEHVAALSNDSVRTLLDRGARWLDGASLMMVEAFLGEDPVTASTLGTVNSAVTAGLVTRDDMRFLCAYFEFLEQRGIVYESVPLEVRIEKRSGALGKGYLAYALLPLSCSLVPASIETVLWTHSEDLTKERFLAKRHGPYVCGSYPGRSKFFAVAAKGVAWPGRARAIADLGLEGYLKIAKPGALYVLQMTMGPEEVAAKVEPKVAVLYKARDENGRWTKRDRFLDGSIPGFTSGGMVEIVGRTFEIPAKNMADLERRGFHIHRLD